MSAPSVTVVIPTYERLEFLEKALVSVANQRYNGPIDAVVVDNSEHQSAKSIVEKFSFATYLWQQTHIPRLPSRTKNAAASRDLGIAYAGGAYVHFLDDDDALGPTAISDKIEAIRKSPNCSGAYNAVERADGTVKYVPDVVVGNELAFVLTNLRPPSLPSAMLVDRDILLDCPPRRTLPHDDLCGLIEILLRTPLAYVDAGLTKRNQAPVGARTLASQQGRLETYNRYAGLRHQLLSDRLQEVARNSFEATREQIAEIESKNEEVGTNT